ncbi:MAG TPA: phenylalanine--tRNA ligase subunit alpha [Solirubrobacterales bacterium]|nr:phenylalanine--tRNA ligase subunit alpha [Solirubrobacterales bacterium]
MNTLDRIEEIRAEAEAEIAAAGDSEALEQLRVRYLGRKAELTAILRGIGALEPAERGPVGKGGNEARRSLEQLLEERIERLGGAELDRRLAEDAIDITLPGTPPVKHGHLHLLTRTRREIEDVFVGLGYRVLEGPEIEHDYYNFTALNHPPGHPARMLQDTFYIDPGTLGERVELFGTDGAPLAGAPGPRDVLLRTHTSPMQVRSMEAQEPPIFIVVPGTVYRRDSDATHTPMFNQVEGLAVAEGITLADLKGTLLTLSRALFGPERDVRIRPHFFPFTEPSVEFDASCFRCDGTGRLDGGERCNLCKGIGWLEIGGAGMVDPNVFGFVSGDGYDPERLQGFAFGMGVERIAMLRYGVPDLRLFFDNDARFLEQF